MKNTKDVKHILEESERERPTLSDGHRQRLLQEIGKRSGVDFQVANEEERARQKLPWWQVFSIGGTAVAAAIVGVAVLTSDDGAELASSTQPITTNAQLNLPKEPTQVTQVQQFFDTEEKVSLSVPTSIIVQGEVQTQPLLRARWLTESDMQEVATAFGVDVSTTEIDTEGFVPTLISQAAPFNAKLNTKSCWEDTLWAIGDDRGSEEYEGVNPCILIQQTSTIAFFQSSELGDFDPVNEAREYVAALTGLDQDQFSFAGGETPDADGTYNIQLDDEALVAPWIEQMTWQINIEDGRLTQFIGSAARADQEFPPEDQQIEMIAETEAVERLRPFVENGDTRYVLDFSKKQEPNTEERSKSIQLVGVVGLEFVEYAAVGDNPPTQVPAYRFMLIDEKAGAIYEVLVDASSDHVSRLYQTFSS